MSKKALRYNEGKPKWSLVHYDSLIPMIRVLEFGAEKYEKENWKKELDLKEILESMQRHLAKLMDGEEFDSESGISHMGHIQCNAMFYNFHKERVKNKKAKFKIIKGKPILVCSKCNAIIKHSKQFSEEEWKAFQGDVFLGEQICESCEDKNYE